jgi:cystathionine beta-lyase
MHASIIFISNKELRERFSEEIKAVGGVQVNMLGLAACRAAYTDGREWLDELLVYLRDNFNLMSSFLSEKLPEISFTAPQGTYLAWLDFAEYGKKRGCETPGALDEFITNRAGLWLDGGDMFGPEGAGFQRINIACTRATLREALEKLAAV